MHSVCEPLSPSTPDTTAEHPKTNRSFYVPRNVQPICLHLGYTELWYTLIHFDPANVDKYTIHWVSGWFSCVSPCQQISPLQASEIHCNDGWPPSILGHCSVVNCTTPSGFRRVSSKSICWIGWFFVWCLCLGIFFVDFFYDFCKLNRCFEFMHPHSLPRASQILCCWISVGWPGKVIFWIDTRIHLGSLKEKKGEPTYFNAAVLFLPQTNKLYLVGGFNPI